MPVGVVVLLTGRVGVGVTPGREAVVTGAVPAGLPVVVAGVIGRSIRAAIGVGFGATMPALTGWACGTLSEATLA